MEAEIAQFLTLKIVERKARECKSHRHGIEKTSTTKSQKKSVPKATN